MTTGKPWRWAWISITGLRFLGIYGRDEYGIVFHAVVDLAATPADQIRNVARDAHYQASAMWRLGAHEEVAVDERLPSQLRALSRRSYEEASPDQTVVLILEPGEVGHFDLPEMH
ncbi:MAG: hypothetical protein ABI591_20315 [Kofleriaceae bacterium]